MKFPTNPQLPKVKAFHQDEVEGNLTFDISSNLFKKHEGWDLEFFIEAKTMAWKYMACSLGEGLQPLSPPPFAPYIAQVHEALVRFQGKNLNIKDITYCISINDYKLLLFWIDR